MDTWDSVKDEIPTNNPPKRLKSISHWDLEYKVETQKKSKKVREQVEEKEVGGGEGEDG